MVCAMCDKLPNIDQEMFWLLSAACFLGRVLVRKKTHVKTCVCLLHLGCIHMYAFTAARQPAQKMHALQLAANVHSALVAIMAC